MVNGTLYDACVEKACLRLKHATVSQTDRPAPFQTGLNLMKNHLLDMWKGREGVMQERLPRYRPDLPEEEQPINAEAPELKLCTLIDECLVLPRDVRGEFLTDPVRAPEWRRILQEFDRTFGSNAGPAPAPTSDQNTESAEAFSWANAFTGEPSQAAEFHSKYDAHVKGKCAWCPELVAYIVDETPDNHEGPRNPPKFFVEAKDDYIIPSEPILVYGAGAWLMDARATQFLEDNRESGHRAVECRFITDEAAVVLEAWFLEHFKSQHGNFD